MLTDHLALLLPLGAVWLAAVITPGPNFLSVTRYAMAHSRQAALAVATGVALGAAVWAVAALLGLQALFRLQPWLLDFARVLGGGYLVYLGLMSLREAWRPSRVLPNATPVCSRGRVQGLRCGLLTSFSNPKTALFFCSIFGALLPDAPPLWLQAEAVTMLLAISLLWYGSVAWFFSLPAPRRVYLAGKRGLDAVTGGLFTALGLRLALVDPGR